jgi:hypothetical protein
MEKRQERGATVAERHSGLERMPADTYVTPRWVYEALYTVEPWAKSAWDCAPVDADTKRIRWDNLSQAKAGPSQNHAWYVWDSEHTGCPRIARL